MHRQFGIALAAIAILALSACSAQAPVANTPTQQREAAKSQEAANNLVFEHNAERDNITKRVKMTANPGQIGFILLLNQAGQPIMYTSARGKITSGSKRLTPPEVLYHGNFNEYGSQALGPGPSDEGTYGTSGEYVFFWTVDGQYIQWNGGYLYSDKPFRTNIQPLVIAQVG